MRLQRAPAPLGGPRCLPRPAGLAAAAAAAAAASAGWYGLSGAARHVAPRAWLSSPAGAPAAGRAAALVRRRAASSAAQAGVTLYTARSTYPALNGWKLTITLEELREAGRLPEGFDVVELNLEELEHKQPWFLEINPNGRIPALVDHSRGGAALFESGAMMLYLAETRGAGVLLPEGEAERYRALQWLFFQASGVGPIQGQAHAFLRYVPEDVPYAKERFVGETRRLYGVLDQALAKGGPFVAGDYSVADVALYPWVSWHAWAAQDLAGLPALRRWLDLVGSRPAVRRGMAYNGKDVAELLGRAEEVRRAVSGSTLDGARRRG